MNLVSICVDVVQSCEGKADDHSNLLLVAVRVERSRTTYGCAEFFVRALGLFTEEDVLGLTAHRRRDSVKTERRNVLIPVCHCQ